MNYTALMALRELILVNARLIYNPDFYKTDVLTAESMEEIGKYEASLAASRDRLVKPLIGTPPCRTREEAMQVLLEYTEKIVATEFHQMAYRKTTEAYGS
ncbi:hypothetical protein SLS56_010897 [Neofusicoccum ribis]|uniref:Uncharacterized protein n=1 Tax=Neofusicoccum ribis TaxID=45134 RepID=A0ABR3SDS0_9PEZI